MPSRDYERWSKDRLLEELNEDLKLKYGEQFNEFSKFTLNSDTVNYFKLDMTEWSEREKDILFKEILIGLYFFFHFFADRKAFNIGGFNSVKDAINGNNSILLYVNGVNRIHPKIRLKIHEQTGKF